MQSNQLINNQTIIVNEMSLLQTKSVCLLESSYDFAHYIQKNIRYVNCWLLYNGNNVLSEVFINKKHNNIEFQRAERRNYIDLRPRHIAD